MVTIKVTAGVQVISGPQVAIADSLEVQAYKKYQFDLNKDSGEVKLDLGKDLTLLLIKTSVDASASPDSPKPQVTCKIGSGDAKTLVVPHVYLESGSGLLLGDVSAVSFTFVAAPKPTAPAANTADPTPSDKPAPKAIDTLTVEILTASNVITPK